jgi:hypothetical protein
MGGVGAGVMSRARATGMGVALTLLAGATARVDAQVPGVLGVEARAGAAVGSFEPSGAGLQMAPGLAWSVLVSWGPGTPWGVYAAYGSYGFGCDDAWCAGQDVTFASRGPSLGARVQAPVRLDPWLRAGLLLHDLEQRWTGPDGRERATADGQLGFEAATGLTWPVGRRIDMVPGLHVGLLPTRVADGETDRAFFTALELGVRFRP